jgi:hypothetical protein
MPDDAPVTTAVPRDGIEVRDEWDAAVDMKAPEENRKKAKDALYDGHHV